jgi:hypothetical protein
MPPRSIQSGERIFSGAEIPESILSESFPGAEIPVNDPLPPFSGAKILENVTPFTFKGHPLGAMPHHSTLSFRPHFDPNFGPCFSSYFHHRLSYYVT